MNESPHGFAILISRIDSLSYSDKRSPDRSDEFSSSVLVQAANVGELEALHSDVPAPPRKAAAVHRLLRERIRRLISHVLAAVTSMTRLGFQVVLANVETIVVVVQAPSKTYNIMILLVQ